MSSDFTFYNVNIIYYKGDFKNYAFIFKKCCEIETKENFNLTYNHFKLLLVLITIIYWK